MTTPPKVGKYNMRKQMQIKHITQSLFYSILINWTIFFSCLGLSFVVMMLHHFFFFEQWALQGHKMKGCVEGKLWTWTQDSRNRSELKTQL